MSLKEWKNGELNTKLMKKWGLLKEGKLPAGDAGHGGSEDDHYQFDKKEREAKLQEDSEGEETYHYGEDEGRDDRELRDLIRRHASRGHIDALKRDMDYDEDHERRRERGTHFREGSEEIDENHVDWARSQGKLHKALTAAELSGLDKESEKDPADYTGTRKREKRAVADLKKGRGLEETASQRISVREAKEITRRIIERIKKEGK